jgi:hypothetical protein
MLIWGGEHVVSPKSESILIFFGGVVVDVDVVELPVKSKLKRALQGEKKAAIEEATVVVVC